jgi:hypothetical protein
MASQTSLILLNCTKRSKICFIATLLALVMDNNLIHLILVSVTSSITSRLIKAFFFLNKIILGTNELFLTSLNIDN